MAVFEPILTALSRRSVRYVVVGGVAIVLQGHPRFTADLDLVLDLADDVAPAIKVLTALGLRPRLPVDATQFADPGIRRRWIEERNLVVFSLVDPDDPFRAVDLFAQEPVPFEELWERASIIELGGESVRIAGIDDLIAMKTAVGRPQDVADIEALQQLAEGSNG